MFGWMAAFNWAIDREMATCEGRIEVVTGRRAPPVVYVSRLYGGFGQSRRGRLESLAHIGVRTELDRDSWQWFNGTT